MKRGILVLCALVILAGTFAALKQNPIQLTLKDPSIEPLLPEMVTIPAGSFSMGHTEGTDYERPVHEVFLSEYSIAKHEVTNAEYHRFCDATGSPWPKPPTFDLSGRYFLEKPDFPVVEITWSDAARYCLWLSRRTGMSYHLPTEAQWEKAARGGLSGKPYPWGDERDTSRACCMRKETEGPMKVGSFAPNAYGLYDMAGNVNEMCSDWYDEFYYAHSRRKDPAGPLGWLNYLSLVHPPHRSRLKGRCHVVRGGSYRAPLDWNTLDADGRYETPLLCAGRDYLYQAPYAHFDLGFRVAMGPG